ncbi:hypothetical protein [Neomesorhizobium albiziae]|uniref:hypothetical protein n=1 Tax=Neomesorhizobium albiziae TaxID=335020 RepID=UPI00165F1AE8|nr:hypothetical protein [Mesorhizobium albiziae]
MTKKINAPPPKPGPKRKPARGRDAQASPEPEHIDPPPRDVREAPTPNPDDARN